MKLREKGFSIVFSFGKNGGFYIHSGYTKRICLWCVAITYFPRDLDEIFNEIFNDISGKGLPE
jgi:hypothetical protein